MAFTWIGVSSGDIAKASHINQVKTNTDILADNLSISHYSWVELPVSIGSKMKATQIDEAQTALDYIDTNNYCSAENIGEYSADQSNYDSGVDSGRNVTINSNVETGLDSANRDSFNNDQHVIYNNNVDTSDYGLYYQSRLSGQNTSANGTANAAAK